MTVYTAQGFEFDDVGVIFGPGWHVCFTDPPTRDFVASRIERSGSCRARVPDACMEPRRATGSG